MKILHINTSDIEGGAARAAYRLHNALCLQGVNSQMLVQDKKSDDTNVITPSNKLVKITNKLRPLVDSLPLRVYKNRTPTLFSPAWLPFSQVPKYIDKINPDIVHLHWINGGMLSINDLKKIKQPIVWSLHDMWAFTGGEHYDEEQKSYLKNSGNSKILQSNQTYDLSRVIWQYKKLVYAKIESLHIIGLSQWLHQSAKASSLLKDKHHYQLPNLIDTEIFAPIEKNTARELLNLPQDKKIVLFGAMGATSDPRKGFTQLYEALSQVNRQNIQLVIFGSSEPPNPPKFNQPVQYMGRIHDDISLKLLYSSADVMIVPSLQENLSNAIMESLACGTPVVAFDVGGNGDMIEHQQNGYLAQPLDTQDLAQGIDWVLNNANYQQLCECARQKVLQQFDSKLVAKQYIALYQDILNK